MSTYQRGSPRVLLVCSLFLAFLLSDTIAAMASGYQGKVLERRLDGGTGEVISGVHVTFTDTGGRIVRSVTTTASGHYRVELRKGGYSVTATHPDYYEYSSAPGFFVVRGRGYQTGNILLRKSVSTTVLLIRHAEKGTTPPQDPPLTSAGQTRANELIHVAEKAGVKAIYATSFLRSQQTVQPLSGHLNVPISSYTPDDYQGLKNMIISHHLGEAVLVAAYSNTVSGIIQAFGDDSQSCPISEDEFDNLCLITYGSGKVKVVNLQYGAPSP